MKIDDINKKIALLRKEYLATDRSKKAKRDGLIYQIGKLEKLKSE